MAQSLSSCIHSRVAYSSPILSHKSVPVVNGPILFSPKRLKKTYFPLSWLTSSYSKIIYRGRSFMPKTSEMPVSLLEKMSKVTKAFEEIEDEGVL